MKRTLAVDLDGTVLATPIMVASGCFGSGRELADLVDVRAFGGAVTGSVTLKPARGLPTPRIAETDAGVLSAVGLQNPGVEGFLERQLPILTSHGIPLFVSVGGTSVEEFVRVTALLQGAPGINAIEVNLSCPNAEQGGEPFGVRLKPALEVIGPVSRLSMLPVWAKLPVDTADLLEVAEACVRAGAHGLTVGGSLPGMAIDPDTHRPRLAAGVGALSGPAIRPVAVQAVFRVARAMPKVPLMGVGGIQTAEDAIEMLLAGAWAVQVGSAMYANPAAPIEIAQGVLAYLKDKGMSAPADLRGRVRLDPRPVGKEG